MPALLIKNGTVVTSDSIVESDVFIIDEKIHKIEPKIKLKAEKTIDAKGMLVLPGGIDPHVHMELPLADTISSDTFETGSIAALHGGTTTIIDFAMQEKGGSLKGAVDKLLKKAKGNCACDFFFHVGVIDWNEKIRKEIFEITNKVGLPSFKAFTAYKGSVMLEYPELTELMKTVGTAEGVICVHAENGELIDSLITKNRKEKKPGTKISFFI